jgi:hypothetical protein
MLRSRINHWTCTKFADFIRGTSKPYGLGWKEWDTWHKNAKESHPFRYWLAEKGFKKLQNFVMFPCDVYRTVKVYITNRWIDQTHIVRTGLKPGEYYEFDYKILHGLFYELVDMVESEMAHLVKYTSENKNKFQFKHGKCEEAGLEYLDWASSLIYDSNYGVTKKDKQYNKPTPQALAAKQIKELYLWWKYTRPNRIDPHSLLKDDSDNDDPFSHISKDKKKIYKQIQKLEESYDKEDTNKLIQLIKIRKDLWT